MKKKRTKDYKDCIRSFPTNIFPHCSTERNYLDEKVNVKTMSELVMND